MAKLRIGIIGCGQIAQQHLNNWAGLADQVEVVAACDINPTALETSAEKFKIPHRYDRAQKLLQRDDLDAVDVCLHNNLHNKAAVAVMESGKHCYCEKPMAGAYKDALSMLETSRRTGKKLHIQLSNIYLPETRAAKELIEAGNLGELYHARSTGFRRRGRPFVDGYGSDNFVQKHISAGGALYDMGVYHISQLLYLLGNPKPERITGKTYQKIDMHEQRRTSSGFNVEELGVGFVRFDGGLSMDIIEAWAIHLDTLEGSTIVGTRGGVRLHPFGYFSCAGDLDLNASSHLDSAKQRWDKVQGTWAPYASSQAHWAAVLAGKVPPLPTAEIALNTMLISEGIYQSEKLGREVTADEVRELSVSTAVAV
jgi:predicted dehydrogenase